MPPVTLGNILRNILERMGIRWHERYKHGGLLIDLKEVETMNYQAYLRRNELVFVEQRLKQYQHIIREMEKRRAALRISRSTLGSRSSSRSRLLSL